MGLYRGWQGGGGGGALCPQFSLDPRMHEDYVYVSACLSFSPSLSPSLSVCGVNLADQGSPARYWPIQVFSWDSKSVPFPINLSWWKPIILIMPHLSVTTTCGDPESFVRGGPTLKTFFLF